jgi:hypothetical protein
MQTHLNRRVAITGLVGASAVAVAVPSGAIAASQCSFPDLAAELADVRKRWVQWTVKEQALSGAGKAHATAMTGITEDQARTAQSVDNESPVFKAWFDAWQAFYDAHPERDPTDTDGGSIALNEISDQLYPICEAILRQPVRSAADLGVYVQAFALINRCEYLDQDDEFRDTRHLADTVCAFCGVEPLAGFAVEARQS